MTAEPTGVAPAVAERLAAIQDLPPDDQPAAYQEVARLLQDALATLDEA